MRAIYSLILIFAFYFTNPVAINSSQKRPIPFFVESKGWINNRVWYTLIFGGLQPSFHQFIMRAINSLIFKTLLVSIWFSSIHRQSDTYLSAWNKKDRLQSCFQQFIMRAIYSLIFWSYWLQFKFSSIHRKGDTYCFELTTK